MSETRGKGYMGEGYFPVGPMPRKAEPIKTERSLTTTVMELDASRIGREGVLKYLLEKALADVPDAQFVTITVYKWTEEPTEFATRESC